MPETSTGPDSASNPEPGPDTEPNPAPEPSPLLGLPGAVAGDGVDAPVAAHYGSFYGEQRTLESGEGFCDLSHRGVVRISGPDRLTWLHSLTSQYFEGLAPHQPTGALLLSPRGHVEFAMYGVDDGEAFTAHVEPGEQAGLVEFLDSMRFMMRVEVADVSDDLAVVWRAASHREDTPYSGYDVVSRAELEAFARAAGPACGMWAFEAMRIARGEPRRGLDTDSRTIPNEAGWIDAAVHLDKGCYRGQETVGKIHTLGRPPRRLTLLHLDGSVDRLPARGAKLTQPDPRRGDRPVGYVGTSARHYELGPIGLGMVKRNVALDQQLLVDGIAATQQVIVDPDVGLHVRPTLG